MVPLPGIPVNEQNDMDFVKKYLESIQTPLLIFDLFIERTRLVEKIISGFKAEGHIVISEF